MTAENRAQLLQWSTVVAAVAGGLLGSLFWNIDLLRLLLVVAASSLLGVAISLGWLTAEPGPVAAPPPPLPVPPPPPVRQWWNETGKSAASAPIARPDAPPLADFDTHRAQLAQCPHCASFELDVRSTERAYAFGCRNPNCQTTWEWAPGTAWPATVVRRNLTGGLPNRAGHTRADS